ncbi:MAG: hypothetical protein ACJ70V_06300 [Nitrososphaera sp.]
MRLNGLPSIISHSVSPEAKLKELAEMLQVDKSSINRDYQFIRDNNNILNADYNALMLT